MNPTLLSTPSALRSCTGASKVSPAAMYVERRIKWEEGEYDAPVTPDRRVLRQKVVGRTSQEKEILAPHIKTTTQSENSHNGGGGRTSSPGAFPAANEVVRVGCGRCAGRLSLFSERNSGDVLLSGGAL